MSDGDRWEMHLGAIHAAHAGFKRVEIDPLDLVALLDELERYRVALSWYADEGHYSDTYRNGAGFVDVHGLEIARAALLGMAADDSDLDAVNAAWVARKALGTGEAT